MNRVAARLRASVFGLVCGLVSGSTLAMGTPPQKVAKPVEAGRSAVMLKADELRIAPDSKSAVLRRIEKGAQVRLLTSQGGWSQISSGGKSGWVRILSVSSPVTESVGFSDLGALGKTPQGKVVAVAGTRGLDQDTLRLASYDAAEVALLHTFAISRAAAEQFGQAAGLRVRAMPYIDAP